MSHFDFPNESNDKPALGSAIRFAVEGLFVGAAIIGLVSAFWIITP